MNKPLINNSPIFIVGCPRSGTTLLRLLLNAHSLIAIPEETWFFGKLYNLLPELTKGDDWRKNVASKILELNSKHFPDLNEKELIENLESIQPDNDAAIISVLNRTFAKQEGKEIWGDKTPGYVLQIALLKKLFPKARLIHIIRDGRDVAESILKNREAGLQTDDYISVVEYWKRHVLAGIIDGEKHFANAYLQIRYEDLVNDSESKLKDICSFLNVPFESQMLEFPKTARKYVPDWQHHKMTKKPITNSEMFKWKKENNLYKNSLFELLAGDIVEQVKYEKFSVFNTIALKDYFVYKVDKWIKKVRLPFIIINNKLKSVLN
ncbi:MAG: sulfotransferase [Fulvivirga sp.]|uniref:sulfotransferase family protein n=1 Tax=Fulvivirga sp. TaxID=1931237 RepID=UPI0032EFD0FC